MKCPTSFLTYFPQVSAGYHKKKRGTFYWCFTQGHPKPLEWLITEQVEAHRGAGARIGRMKHQPLETA